MSTGLLIGLNGLINGKFSLDNFCLIFKLQPLNNNNRDVAEIDRYLIFNNVT